MTDIPGQHRFAELRNESFTAIQQGKEKVLLLTFSAGFLKTLGILGEPDAVRYKRPDKDQKANIKEYLSSAPDEEIEWLNSAVSGVSRRRIIHSHL